MSYKQMAVALAAVVVLFACTVALAGTNSMGFAERQTINFSAPTIIGGTVLPAGDYKVTHEMQGQTHVMIFTRSNGKVEAKTNCKLVSLKQKAERTQQTYTVNANNQRVLQEITFAGDKATHVLAQ